MTKSDGKFKVTYYLTENPGHLNQIYAEIVFYALRIDKGSPYWEPVQVGRQDYIPDVKDGREYLENKLREIVIRGFFKILEAGEVDCIDGKFKFIAVAPEPLKTVIKVEEFETDEPRGSGEGQQDH